MQNSSLIEKIHKLPPETIVEVENFVDFLTEKQKAKNERYQTLLAFAEEYGGTELDFNEELESASVEHLLKTKE
jgi:hypothetical protein